MKINLLYRIKLRLLEKSKKYTNCHSELDSESRKNQYVIRP